jgi:hypothetical protein
MFTGRVRWVQIDIDESAEDVDHLHYAGGNACGWRRHGNSWQQKREGAVATRRAAFAAREEASDLWWVFLGTGIIWLWASIVVLRFDNRSITAVGVIMGVVFLGAAANEAMIAGLSLGWRWAHWVLAAVFALGALWAFIRPEDAFWALASVLGFVLVIKGTADIAEAAATRNVNDLWWVGLVAGILEIVLAFWVSQQFYPARADLLILWVGFAALFRGVTEIALAFRLRRT